MTLGSLFRDYVYIPMGGNRVSRPRWILNILTVWMLTGLWHGAAWTFVLWGLLFAVLLVFEKTPVGSSLLRIPILSRVYVLLAVMISFVLFNANGLPQAGEHIAALFGGGNVPLISEEALYYGRSFALPIIIGIIGATPLPAKAVAAIGRTKPGGRLLNTVEPLILLVLLLACTAFLVDGSFNPFLYFRF